VQQTVSRSVEAGLLAGDPAGAVAATGRGQEFLSDLFALHARALTECWRPHAGPVDRLNAVLARVIAAAGETAGAAWAVQTPPYEPPGGRARGGLASGRADRG
jgi:hypothetical protein